MPDDQIPFTADAEQTPAATLPPSPVTNEELPIPFAPDPQATQEEKYGTAGQQLATVAEGAAQGLAGPLATYAETKGLGIKPEDIEGRAETNPIEHLAAETAGLALPAMFTAGAPEAISTVGKLAEFTQGGLLGRAGAAAAKAAGVEGTALGAAVRLSTESMLLQGGDELSKEILGNPDSVQTAAANIGLSGLIGAGVGYPLGKVSELWQAKFGPSANKFTQEMVDRLKAIGNDSLPTTDAVHEELSNEFGAVNAARDDIRGGEGLKAQDIQSLLPKYTEPPMVEQANSVLSKTNELLTKARDEPGIYQGPRLKAVEDYAARLASVAQDPTATPVTLFSALDDFKKGIGTLKDWNVFSPEVEKPGAALVGKLYNTVRTGLEDEYTWGKAGARQAAINKVFSEYIPASKDFERAFTEKVGGQPTVSAGKVNTLINGLGKPNAEIRLEKLGNYIEANDNLYSQLDTIHQNLGIESPYQRPSLANVRAVLNEITPGMKAADFIHVRASEALSEALGEGIGAASGHLSGIPGGGLLGAYFGHYAIKPFIKTMMPSIIKPLLRIGASGQGLKAAFDALGAISKGETKIQGAVKALFETGTTTTLNNLSADDDKLDKLDKQVDYIRGNPQAMMDVGGELGHYLPDHNVALASTAQNALTYLASQKPGTTQNGPLARKEPPTPTQEAAYKRTLGLAEQPLSVLSKVKSGSLTPKDVGDLKALYPALYPKIVNHINQQMIEHMSKGHTVPFKMRGPLGLLTGQPMDPTFTQPQMAAIQATFTKAAAPTLGPPPGKAKKGTAKLGKSAELAQTPAEDRQQALQKS